MNIRVIVKKYFNAFANWYRVRSRRKDWVTFATTHTKQRTLTDGQKKEIDKLYLPYKKTNYIFWDFYKEKRHKFEAKIVPDDLYYGYVDPFYNDWDMASYLDNKCYYAKLFQGVKQPRIIAMRVNSFWLSAEWKLLTAQKVYELLKSEGAFFVKIAVESDGGHGVTYFEDASDKFKFIEIINSTKADIIIQAPVVQHEVFAKLNRSCVNTIRVLSLLSEDGVKIYSTVIRIGVNGSKVDNGSSGGLTCGILPDYSLKREAHNKYGETFTVHPNTSVIFEGYKLIGIDNIHECVKRLHPQVPHFRLVSWDFSVDELGTPVLIEANFKYGGVTINQLNNGPVFGEDTEIILKEVFG